MKHRCDSCGAKARCLKRAYLIFTLYIATGRINELTPQVKDNLCCEDDCEHWLPVSAEGQVC